MPFRRRFLLVALLAITFPSTFIGSSSGAAGQLVLVVNAKNAKSPSKDEAKQLFLGETMFWPGNVAVRLVLRPADSPAGEAFYTTLGVAPSRLKRVWQEKQLSGQGNAPDTIAAAPAMVAKIAADPGGIGFAMADEVAGAAGVRVIPFN